MPIVLAFVEQEACGISTKLLLHVLTSGWYGAQVSVVEKHGWCCTEWRCVMWRAQVVMVCIIR